MTIIAVFNVISMKEGYSEMLIAYDFIKKIVTSESRIACSILRGWVDIIGVSVWLCKIVLHYESLRTQ